MEVEAKFVIPDRDTQLRLQRVVRLGPFSPGESVLQRVRDLYLDTGGRALYQNGFACRFRHRDGTRVVTLKGLGQANSAVHERFESELPLPEEATIDPATWPEWSGRELVLSLAGEEPLEEQFVIDQERHVRPLVRGERLVAELSVDEVTILAAGQRQEMSILEAELAPDGTIDDMHVLVEHLTATWALLPEPHSKFEIGLALLMPDDAGYPSPADRVSVSDRVSALERAEIERLIERTQDQQLVQRARLILGWGDGVPVYDLCMEVGLSLSWSYELIKRFRQERLAFFSTPQAAQADLPPDQEAGKPDEGSVGDAVPLSREERMTVDEMFEQFQVDVAHARCVRDHALALFDATRSIHKLGPERRRLLEVVGLLHNVGLESDPDRHHVAGAEIISENPLVGVSEIERRMLAAAVYLHRKRIGRKRLRADVVTSLPPSILRDTLILAALVRLADGLDYSQNQSSVLDEVRISSAAIQVVVSGPCAQVDAARAQAKADLWEMLFDAPFFFSAVGMPQVEPASDIRRSPPVPPAEAAAFEGAFAPALGKFPGVLPDDSMSEAGRKVLYYHLARMLQHEPGTRAGQDIEELHDMRVAARRMRSAFRIFAPYFKARVIRGYVVGLRRTGRVLGAVRDLDVFMERARSYLDVLPPERAGDLDPLLHVWRVQREQARGKMIDYLDGDRYRDFVDAFRLFLQTPGAGTRKGDDIPPRPTRVNHVAPQLIYTCWAGVQAFGPLLDGAPVSILHALRIECKRLRYTIEFFEEVLAPEAREAVAEVVRLQDHLGSLHDADVANALLSDFLFPVRGSKAPERTQSDARVIAPGVVSYLAAKQSELQTLVATFPKAWARFNRPEVRRWLADAVAVL
jgi:CHAD domain-containing protein